LCARTRSAQISQGARFGNGKLRGGADGLTVDAFYNWYSLACNF
jgi:hypothetical protein